MTTSRRKVVELRVHGVGGASADYTLADRDVFQVAGDALAGFFRGARRPRNLEAYSWGGLTTGSITRALWILLLPFAVVNLAGFMFPEATGWRAVAHRHAVRVLGLVVTVFYTLWLCSFFMDSIAWQLMQHVVESDSTNSAVAGWLAGNLPMRLTFGALAAGVCAALLHLVPHLTRVRAAPTGDHASEEELSDPAVLDMRNRRFWEGHGFVAHLARFHGAASANTVALSAWLVQRELGGEATVAERGIIASAVLFAILGLSVVLLVHARALSFTLVIGSVVHALTAVLSLAASSLHVGNGYFTVWDWPVRVATFVAAACLTVLIITSLASAAPHTVHSMVLAYGLSILVVHLGGASVAVQGADWIAAVLGVDSETAVPVQFHLSGLATVLVFSVLAAFLLVIYLRTNGPESVVHAIHDRMLPAAFGVTWIALVLHVGYIAWVVGQLLPGGWAGTMPFELDLDPTVARLEQWWQDSRSDFVTVGGWCTTTLTVGSFFALLYYWRNAPTDVELRRNVGRVWDVATFWPRWFHPLAPPTSSQRAVPELRARIAAFRSKGRDVLLSAHSQGSVLAFATLTGMHCGSDVALLTHGSPLARIYARFFPRYFDAAAFEDLRRHLDARWQNLYRETDPIAGRIFGDDRAVQDPSGWNCPPHLGRAVVRAALAAASDEPGVHAGHLHYDRTRPYHDAVRKLLRGLRPRPTPPGAHASTAADAESGRESGTPDRAPPATLDDRSAEVTTGGAAAPPTEEP